jgi:hypothetical protein
MTGEVTEYIIIDFIDDMEEAIFNAEKHDMETIMEGLNSLHGEFQDLGNAENSQEKIARLKADIEQPLHGLVEACQAGEAVKAGEIILTLKDKMDALKGM